VARMLRNLGIMAKFQGESEQISAEEEHVNAG